MSDLSKSSTVFGRLALMVDLNPASWAAFFAEGNDAGSAPLTLSDFLDQVLALAHQYSMLNRDNRVSLMTFGSECSLHYPPIQDEADGASSEEAVPKFDFAKFKSALESAVHGASVASASPSKLASLHVALSRMLLHLNRQERDLGADRDDEADLEMPTFLGSDNFPARIVIFSPTLDIANQNMACLNALFACHKQGITIDSIFISSELSSQVLQMAAEMTSGCYFKVSTVADLQKVILSRLLVDAAMREDLKVPKLAAVSHKATCFCHKRLISIGYVCSVCLSVFCQPQIPCQVCGVFFAEESVPSPLGLAINSVP